MDGEISSIRLGQEARPGRISCSKLRIILAFADMDQAPPPLCGGLCEPLLDSNVFLAPTVIVSVRLELRGYVVYRQCLKKSLRISEAQLGRKTRLADDGAG